MIYSNKYSSKMLCICVYVCTVLINLEHLDYFVVASNASTNLLKNIAEASLFLQQTKFLNATFKIFYNFIYIILGSNLVSLNLKD